MTNKDLINELLKSDYLNTLRIIKAFEKIDRVDFVPNEYKTEAYENFPIFIGHGQTISQPATVAFMLEKLQPEEGDKVLDVGSGSAWQTALIADIVKESGHVIGLEIKDDLLELGKRNIERYNFHNLTMVQGNGWLGLPEEAPFDRIIVSAATETVPEVLKAQLAINGRLVVPVGRGYQDIIVIDRLDQNNFEERYYPGFSFVPLINS